MFFGQGRPGDKGQKGDASSNGYDILSAVKVISYYESQNI